MVTLAAVRLLASGDARLTFDTVSTWLLVAGFAVANAAILAMPIRLWTAPRPATLALAFIVSAAWPLSGYPLPAAILATIAAGLSLGRDRRCRGGRRVGGFWPATLLAAVAAVTVCAGMATATTHPIQRHTAPAATAHRVPAPSLDLGAASPIDASPCARPPPRHTRTLPVRGARGPRRSRSLRSRLLRRAGREALRGRVGQPPRGRPEGLRRPRALARRLCADRLEPAAGPRGRDGGDDRDGPSRPRCPRPRLRDRAAVQRHVATPARARRMERDRTPRARARRQCLPLNVDFIDNLVRLDRHTTASMAVRLAWPRARGSVPDGVPPSVARGRARRTHSWRQMRQD